MQEGDKGDSERDKQLKLKKNYLMLDKDDLDKV